MNECITLAKVRKETKITVPAGGWVILVSPNDQFDEHQKTRNKLNVAVNDDYEKIIIGRLRNTHSDIRLLTSAEKKASEKELEAFNKSLVNADDDSKKRQARIDKEKADNESTIHAEKLAEVNKVNDQIRNSREKKTVVETQSESK